MVYSLPCTCALLFQPKLKIINWDHNRNNEKKEQAKQFSNKHQHLLIILSVFCWLAPHIYVSFPTPTAPPNQPLMDDPIVFHDELSHSSLFVAPSFCCRACQESLERKSAKPCKWLIYRTRYPPVI